MHETITLTFSLHIQIDEFIQTSSKFCDPNRVEIDPKKKNVLRIILGKVRTCFEPSLVFTTIWKTIVR